MSDSRPGRPRSVYDGARVEELNEPLLPRWFVLLMVGAIPVALGVAVWAFIVFGPEEVPVAERRPPPDPTGQLTTDVGQYNVGESESQPLPLVDCPLFRGIRAAGSDLDRERVDLALSTLCEERLPEDVARRMQLFASVQGEIRFAQFQATGIDSTMDFFDPEQPRILLNARFAREDTDPLWIAPIVVHDTTYLEQTPGTVEAALQAREYEADACRKLFDDPGDRPSRACEDAYELLDFISPPRALEDAGFTAG